MSKAAGRPPNKNRAAAQICGDMTYAGKPCRKCGSTERYTKGAACVQCQRAYMVESRQVFKASQMSGDPGPNLDFLAGAEKPAIGDLDFLDLDKPVTLSQVNSYSPSTNSQRETVAEKKTDVSAEPRVTPSADPEPLCPECGCNVEADHDQVGGWLHRTSPWRCTICDWVDPKPAPTAPKLGGDESLDSFDFLG